MSSDSTNTIPVNQAVASPVEVLKDPAEMSDAEIKAERAKLELIKSRLELAKLRRDNAVAESKELELRDRAAREGKNFEELRKRDMQMQASCTHRKGGMDTAAMNKQGNDSNFSVIKHTGTFGGTTVLCTRCTKLWLPSDPDHGGKSTPGYVEALRYPTDNQPSSSVVFSAQPTFSASASA